MAKKVEQFYKFTLFWKQNKVDGLRKYDSTSYSFSPPIDWLTFPREEMRDEGFEELDNMLNKLNELREDHGGDVQVIIGKEIPFKLIDYLTWHCRQLGIGNYEILPEAAKGESS